MLQATGTALFLGFKPNKNLKEFDGLMINQQITVVTKKDKLKREIIFNNIDACHAMT